MKGFEIRIRTVPDSSAPPSAKNWRAAEILQGDQIRMAVILLKSKILVVEDDPDVLNVMVCLLRRAGFEVTSANTGEEGIRFARQEEFDLITLDVDLPDMCGFEVCARLKQDFRFCRTPVILISGRFGEEDWRRGWEAGAADFIAKPFDASTLLACITSRVKPVKI